VYNLCNATQSVLDNFRVGDKVQMNFSKLQQSVKFNRLDSRQKSDDLPRTPRSQIPAMLTGGLDAVSSHCVCGPSEGWGWDNTAEY